MHLKVDVKGLQETEQYFKALAQGELAFGVAKGLTDLANAARDAVVWDLPNRMTLRTPWFKPGSQFGFNVERATKRKPVASIYSRAPWLKLQEEGGTKRPMSGHRLAVPTAQVRRTKRDLIPKPQRPAGLGAKAFTIKTKSGATMLATRVGKGKRSQLRILYTLTPSASIQPRLKFYETVRTFIDKPGTDYILRGIEYALRTAK